MKKALAQRNMNTLAAWPAPPTKRCAHSLAFAAAHGAAWLAAWPLLPGLRQRPLVALKLGPPLLAPVCLRVHVLTQKKI
jgi:hypothetical protein